MTALKPCEIRQRRPFRCLIWIFLVVILTGTGQWYWHKNISAEQAGLRAEIAILQTQLRDVRSQFETVRAASKNQQQSQAMQEATTNQLESRLQYLQQKVIGLNKELMFYQNITQGNGSSKLQIRELQLRSDNEQAGFIRYRIVVTQGENINEPISGKVLIRTANADQSAEKQVALGEHALSLRHVQVLEGSFKITDPLPEKLLVTLTRKDKTLTSRSFDWQDIVPDDL